MSAYSGQDPINCNDLTVTYSQNGLLVKKTGNKIDITSGYADIPVAVTIDESSRDAAGNLDSAGNATVSVLPLAGVQYLRCQGGGALVVGESLFVHEPATPAENGRVHTTGTVGGNPAKFVGYYMGEKITPAAGDLIPVLCRSA